MGLCVWLGTPISAHVRIDHHITAVVRQANSAFVLCHALLVGVPNRLR